MRITVLVLAASLVAACGGAAEEGTKATDPTKGGAKKTTPGDVSFEVPPIDVKGVVFEPEALGRPGMSLVESKKKTTLDKQRKLFVDTKDPVQKEAQAAVLATMLYLDVKSKSADEQAKAYTEARQALRDAAQISGKNVDEITLRLMGTYDLLLDDYASASTNWQALVDKNPKDKEVGQHRAWLVLSLLRQFKNADALAAVKNETITDKQPELAYVAAWAKWRSNDDAGAWQAMVAAAKGWGSNPGRDALERDVLLFAGRANVPFDQAVPQLQSIFGKAPKEQSETLAKLGVQSYSFAGRWTDGITAIDKAIAVGGQALPANQKPVLRYQQAEFEVRLDAPDTAAKFAKQALDEFPACGTSCSDKEKQEIITNIFNMGRLFHVLYATANDQRYYQPAKDIYVWTFSLISDTKQKAENKKSFEMLEKTLANTKVGTGTHQKEAISTLLSRHNQEAQACYESVLAANPKLGGAVILNLEIEQAGNVKGVSTEPKAGLADISAVAGCLGERAKTWKLPKRGQAGSTRIKLTYNLSPRKP
jgi:tetratricopeptide (TPR) repeat protein